MHTRLYLRLAEFLIPAIAALVLFSAWRADRRDRAQLAVDLAAAKQSLAQADTRQHDRDAQLLQTLAGLAAEKRAVTMPAEILRALPQQIPLPAPIRLQSQPTPPEADGGRVSTSEAVPGQAAKPGGPAPAGANQAPSDKTPGETQAVIPAEDLKPLYDFGLDCKACQARLAASQADLSDEKAKTTVLTRERDEAVRAAKGGSALRRIARAAKWLAIGVAAGAIAARASH
jgi:hypothetical protein